MQKNKLKKYLIITLIMITNTVVADDFYNVKYISNYDGDTIRFELKDDYPDIFRFMPIRLYGINTPETITKDKTEKKEAYQAKNFVKKELKKAKNINLKECKKDKYFRLLCRVEYDNKDLTAELLKRKYGCEYYGGKKQNFENCKNNKTTDLKK